MFLSAWTNIDFFMQDITFLNFACGGIGHPLSQINAFTPVLIYFKASRASKNIFYPGTNTK